MKLTDRLMTNERLAWQVSASLDVSEPLLQKREFPQGNVKFIRELYTVEDLLHTLHSVAKNISTTSFFYIKFELWFIFHFHKLMRCFHVFLLQ